MSKSKTSTMITIRMPNYIIEDIKTIQSHFPSLTMSRIIVFAVAKDIQRYKG